MHSVRNSRSATSRPHHRRRCLTAFVVVSAFAALGPFTDSASAASSVRGSMYECVAAAADWLAEQEDPGFSHVDFESKWTIPLCEAGARAGMELNSSFFGGFVLPHLVWVLEKKNVSVGIPEAVHALRLIRDGGDVDAFVEQLNEKVSERTLYLLSTRGSEEVTSGRMMAFIEFSGLITYLRDNASWGHAIASRALELAGTSGR